jgi:signal transduction histidine kinase
LQLTEIAPGLADAADVLSDQLRTHLQRLAVFLLPHAGLLERKFEARLKKLDLPPKVRSALRALTPVAAAKILASGRPPLKFIEQVEYNGRRLAKLNLSPSSVVHALEEYDRLLTPLFKKLLPAEYANFQWVREQLHFCVVLTLNNAYYQVREAETQAFYELFRVELESRNLDELLRRFLETLLQVCHADAGHLYLLNDAQSSWVLRASASGRRTPGALREVHNHPGLLRSLARAHQIDPKNGTGALLLEPGWKNRYQACWSVPLATGGRTAGVMQFGFSKPYEWLPREEELLAAAAERCLMAAEKARLMEDLADREEQVRRLAEHMLHVEEIERRRISRELHDEAGQSLLCIRLQMELLENSLPPERTEWIGKLRETRDLTERTILEMRRLIAALSPAVLEQLGLGAALRQLVNRFRKLYPSQVRLYLTKLGRLPQQTETILYRLVQECCNNIAKHSSATKVNILAHSSDGMVKLTVEDNGVGFQVEEALARRDSFGLSGMRERVALLGGRFEVQSHPRDETPLAGRRKGRGTRILITLPLAKTRSPEAEAERPKLRPREPRLATVALAARHRGGSTG